MKIIVSKDEKSLGQKSASHIAQVLNECIAQKGSARVVLSTGASQLPMFEALIQEKVDWSRGGNVPPG